MKFSLKRAGSIAALATVTALVATGCAGSSETTTDPSAAEELTEMTKISVAALPIAPTAALILGIEEGIFEKHNLEVDLTTGQGGAAILPAVAQGQVNFAIGQPLPIILAASKGIDVKIIGNYSASYAEGDDINGVAALDPSIASPKDLEGKRVAVNTLKAAGDLTIMEAIEQDGGDPSNVEWVEVPFPEMQAQLVAGELDAAWLPEPFLSKTIREGGQLVTYNNQDTIPGLTTLVGFTSGAYMDENPAVVKAFQEALAETRALANDDVDAARSVLPEFLGMPEEAAANLLMEDFGPELNVDSIQKLQELMVKFEFMEEEINLDDLIVE
ncbi:MAG: ABC transporter substrate-binding protein [Salinibacterium sp.]|nr:ABC transporter substrate-binding protein [Salinibacterium sp.]MBF0673604.1 ABC transporter substrate-binding protein [Salinibacterium sp.]